jgi:hypothetical protein
LSFIGDSNILFLLGASADDTADLASQHELLSTPMKRFHQQQRSKSSSFRFSPHRVSFSKNDPFAEEVKSLKEEDLNTTPELPHGMKSMSMEDLESFKKFTDQERHLVTEDTEDMLSRAEIVVTKISRSKSSEH